MGTLKVLIDGTWVVAIPGTPGPTGPTGPIAATGPTGPTGPEPTKYARRIYSQITFR